jgi:hypothetical protein
MKVDRSGAERTALLLSLFSPEQVRYIIAACAGSSSEVNRQVALIQDKAGKSLSRALSLTDGVNTSLLYPFLLGMSGAIRADRAQSAVSQERAQNIANYLGAPISVDILPKDSVFQHIMEATPEGKAYLSAIANIKNADKKAARIIPFYYLLGEQLTRSNGLAQLIGNEMEETIEMGDVNDDRAASLIAAKEIGDTLEEGAPDEFGDATGTAIDLAAGGAGGLAGYAASKFARSFFRKRKRRRRAKVAVLAATPAAQEATATLPADQQKSVLPDREADSSSDVQEPTQVSEGQLPPSYHDDSEV